MVSCDVSGGATAIVRKIKEVTGKSLTEAKAIQVAVTNGTPQLLLEEIEQSDFEDYKQQFLAVNGVVEFRQ